MSLYGARVHTKYPHYGGLSASEASAEQPAPYPQSTAQAAKAQSSAAPCGHVQSGVTAAEPAEVPSRPAPCGGVQSGVTAAEPAEVPSRPAPCGGVQSGVTAARVLEPLASQQAVVTLMACSQSAGAAETRSPETPPGTRPSSPDAAAAYERPQRFV